MSGLTLPKKTMLFSLLLVTFSPLGIDLFLPSMGYILSEYRVSAALSQWTISSFTLGQDLAQIPFGAIADRIGRRGVSLIGLTIFFIGSIIPLFVPNIEMLIVSRFIQGIGAGATVVCAFTMVRDQYSGEEAAIKYSWMGIALNVIPSGAPLLGALILLYLGFEYNFIVFAALAFVVFFKMRETRSDKTEMFDNVTDLFRVQWAILRQRASWPGALLSILSLCFIISYVSLSPIILMETHKMPADQFGLVFGANALLLAISSYVVSLVNRKFGSYRSIDIGLIFMAIGMAALIYNGQNNISVLGYVLPIAITSIGFAFTIGNASAAALEPHGERAGVASGLLGALQMITASFVAALVIGFDQGVAKYFGAIFLLLIIVLGTYTNPSNH